MSKLFQLPVLTLSLLIAGCSSEDPFDLDWVDDLPEFTWYQDTDGDGYSNGNTQLSTGRPTGFYMASELVELTGDCDDTNDTVNPGGTEIDADGVDQDCNGFEISGPDEVVYDWTTDRCEDLDIPDFPARAFVDSSGQAQLIASHNHPRRFLGPNLNNLTHNCDIVMTSHHDADPAMFNDEEWIGATYTEDGQTIYAIVHNEYEGWMHPDQCSTSWWTMDCWYNGLTLAISTDSGVTYNHSVAAPLHMIAASSLPYEKDSGPHGIFHPSSIVKADDGYYYAFVHRVRKPAPNDYEQWSCLMRTPDLADPDAWRFWNGDMFAGAFVNPYTDAIEDPIAHDCPAVDREAISDMTQSLTYSDYLGVYILVGTSTSDDGANHGFFISFSEDLIDWTPRVLASERALPWTVQNLNDPFYAYPSLLDPESASRSFDVVGKTAYVYFSRNNRASNGLDSDMLRLPIEFFAH